MPVRGPLGPRRWRAVPEKSPEAAPHRPGLPHPRGDALAPGVEVEGVDGSAEAGSKHQVRRLETKV